MLYPFTAIVGQDEMKLALLLNAINPSIGGVLIEGEKGTASLRLYVHYRACYLPWKQGHPRCPLLSYLSMLRQTAL